MIEELSLVLPLSRPAETGTSLAALVETYSTLLFRVAHSVLRNPTEAEDAVQDTFVRVMEHRRTLPEVRDLGRQPELVGSFTVQASPPASPPASGGPTASNPRIIFRTCPTATAARICTATITPWTSW